MAEDYKGQFKDIKKEFGIPIKEIKILDAKGKLGDTHTISGIDFGRYAS